ncbi:hypothetical protein LBMAG49_19810 [Planctomycetota bacterium]|nr:hypothetical protein LBMAG49_19810 [Planctomycetota bacterium]
MPYLGEFAAVATAVCWTFSSLYFALATKRVSGLPINQFRLLLAVPLLFLLQRVFEGVWWPLLPGDRLPQLVMSGLIGLVLGDIGYFYALFVIGPRISSVLMATWPAMAVAVQWLFRGEVPSFAMVVGIVTTCIGVILVLLRGNDSTSWQSKYTRWQWRLAIAGALLGAIGQALGSVLAAKAASKALDLPQGLPGISTALVRMLAASCGITLVAAIRGQPLAFLRVFSDRQALFSAVGGTAFGPIIGVWFSMVALAHADVGVAATMMATVPLFMLPVARIAYGARISVLAVVGTMLAVAGIALMLCAK